MKILLVEDEDRIADLVCTELGARGISVRRCADGTGGLEAAQRGSFDALVLDLMLPGIDGLSILRALRESGDATPVILLTARSELGDRVRGLEAGADDYLAKPFFIDELAARLHALVRRSASDRVNTLHVGDLVLDRLTRQVSCRQRHIDLTGREYALLEFLIRSPDRVFTRSEILEHVWGYDFDPMTNVVDVCVRRLRAKLAEVAGTEAVAQIEAVRGAGYRLRRNAAE